MRTPKSLFGTIAAACLPVLLFSFGVLYSVQHVLGSPQPLKEALSGSGLYDSVIADTLRKAGIDAGDTATASLPIDDPGVRQAIEQALPPDALQQKSEGAIDSLYRWVQGTTPDLDIAVDLEDTKNKLADNLAAYARQRAADLPTCSDTTTAATITNPLTATCVPAGFDAASAGDTIKNEILNNKDFLSDTTIAADDLKNSSGQALDEQLGAVPVLYEQIKWATFATGVLSVLCILATLLLSGSWQVGCKRLGWIMVPVGAVSALLAWGTGFVIHKLADGVADNQNLGAVHSAIISATDSLTKALRNWWLIYGISLVLAGIIALVISRSLSHYQRRAVTANRHPAPTASPGVASLEPITDAEARAATAGEADSPEGAPRRKK
jgi:hypothetical protein